MMPQTLNFPNVFFVRFALDSLKPYFNRNVANTCPPDDKAHAQEGQILDPPLIICMHQSYVHRFVILKELGFVAIINKSV